MPNMYKKSAYQKTTPYAHYCFTYIRVCPFHSWLAEKGQETSLFLPLSSFFTGHNSKIPIWHFVKMHAKNFGGKFDSSKVKVSSHTIKH